MEPGHTPTQGAVGGQGADSMAAAMMTEAADLMPRGEAGGPNPNPNPNPPNPNPDPNPSPNPHPNPHPLPLPNPNPNPSPQAERRAASRGVSRREPL